MVPVFRSTHSAEFTARGVANGVFWGLTPTVGLQTIAIAAVWFVGKSLFRRDSSLLQAYIWVWINNPLTMVPMYYAFYVTGLWLTADGSRSGGYSEFVELWTAARALGWWDGGVALLRGVGVPLFVGAAPYAVGRDRPQLPLGLDSGAGAGSSASGLRRLKQFPPEPSPTPACR